MTRDTLRNGDQGDDVKALQSQLFAAGYPMADGVDGDFGPQTFAAVLAFQVDRPEIDDTGIADALTRHLLERVLAERPPTAPAHPVELVPANVAVWDAYLELVDALAKNVRYGPGRGLWDPATDSDGDGAKGEFLVTYGAGQKHGTVGQWPNVEGHAYPSFHCSSFTNFILAWLYLYNQDYTHAGNIPQLSDLVRVDRSLHKIPGGGVYRGYGEVITPIGPDGSGEARTKLNGTVDVRELFERRGSMPTFVVWEQSTRNLDGSYRLWHHTGMFAFWQDHMFRIAADGYRGPHGYSAAPMRFREITKENLAAVSAGIALHAYGCDTFDGSYGPPDRSIAHVAFET